MGQIGSKEEEVMQNRMPNIFQERLAKERRLWQVVYKISWAGFLLTTAILGMIFLVIMYSKQSMKDTLEVYYFWGMGLAPVFLVIATVSRKRVGRLERRESLFKESE